MESDTTVPENEIISQSNEQESFQENTELKLQTNADAYVDNCSLTSSSNIAYSNVGDITNINVNPNSISNPNPNPSASASAITRTNESTNSNSKENEISKVIANKNNGIDSSKPQFKSEIKPEIKSEIKSEGKREAKLEGKTDIKSDLQSEIKEPQIVDYLNYRDYLRSFYLYKRELTKNHIRQYNYSYFSAAADIRSPNYLRLVIEGQRNLSEEMALKFAKAMQLNKVNTDDFVLLVNYNQESDPSLRNQYLKNLSDFRLQRSLKEGQIDKKTHDRIPNWIGWILHTLIDQENSTFAIPTLKQLLRNKVSENEIQQALTKLLDSGEMIADEKTGAFKKGRSLINNPEDIPVVLIRRLQTQLMCLGMESLFQDCPTEREFGTLTLSLTKSEFEDLRFQLRKFRKQIHKDNAIQRMKSKGERVYQLNLQLYPVTDKSQTVSELSSEVEVSQSSTK